MATQPIRWAPLALLALVFGLVQVAVGVGMYLAGVYFEPWTLGVVMALQAVYIVAGNWWYGKHVLKGQTTYPKALLVGVVVSVGVGGIYAIYNLISVSFVYPHFLEEMIQAQFARASVGLDSTNAARLLESLRTQITLPALALANFMSASRFGVMLSVLLSLAFAARWRRGRMAAGQARAGAQSR